MTREIAKSDAGGNTVTPQKNTFNGILNVYKEQGYTSHDVVAKLLRVLKQKKIGHTGTLDPAAEGVLPVCLGKATKVCELLTDKDKTYQAVLHLGVVTDTQDMTGEILEQKDAAVSEAEVREAILGFVGRICTGSADVLRTESEWKKALRSGKRRKNRREKSEKDQDSGNYDRSDRPAFCHHDRYLFQGNIYPHALP